MSNTATAPAEKPATAKLIAPLTESIKHLKVALEKGTNIKALRIRNGDELDTARGNKLEWTQNCTDLLAQLFDNTSVADYYNDWVGKIFPEYAEFGNFVDQFYEEMDHRLSRLRTVLKRVEQALEAQNGPLAESLPSTAFPQSAPEPEARPAPESRPAPIRSNQSPTHRESHMASPTSNKVLFVSHGPKDPSSEAVLQFIQQLNFGVMEADHANGLIDTLEGRNDMAFVVVMNVGNSVDHGKGALSDSSVFKLGYVAGKIGMKRMCMVHGPAQAALGENHGIAHVTVDPGGGWQLQLARQMKRAGLDIDLNRLA